MTRRLLFQRRQPGGQVVDLGLLGGVLGLEGLVFGVEALDGGEGDAVGVDGADGGVIVAHAKGGVEVLGGGTDVTH